MSATKISAARLAPGMTVRLVDLESLAELAASTTSALLANLFREDIEKGLTHSVACGSFCKSSPVRTVATVEAESQWLRNANEVKVTFVTGEVARLSTRQKVEVVD